MTISRIIERTQTTSEGRDQDSFTSLHRMLHTERLALPRVAMQIATWSRATIKEQVSLSFQQAFFLASLTLPLTFDLAPEKPSRNSLKN